MALRRKFGGGCGDVRNLELEAGLGDWDLGWPFRGAETGIGCFWKGPQPEVLRPFKLLGEHVVTLFAFKGQAQAVLVERSSCFSVPHDGSEAGHELDVHGVHLRSVSIAHWKFLSPVPGQDSLPLVPIPAVYLSTRSHVPGSAAGNLRERSAQRAAFAVPYIDGLAVLARYASRYSLAPCLASFGCSVQDGRISHWRGCSGGRNCGGRESVTGKVRPEDHDDVNASDVRDRYGRGQRLDRCDWHPELGSDERGRRLLRRDVIDRCRRCRRRSVLWNGDTPSLLLELLSEMGTGVGFLSAVCHENLHTCVSNGRRGG